MGIQGNAFDATNQSCALAVADESFPPTAEMLHIGALWKIGVLTFSDLPDGFSAKLSTTVDAYIALRASGLGADERPPGKLSLGKIQQLYQVKRQGFFSENPQPT